MYSTRMKRNFKNSNHRSDRKREKRPVEEGLMVNVYDNDVNKALRRLKRKVADAGILKTIHEKKAYEKPSDKRRRLKKAATRRTQLKLQKRKEQHGY